MSLGQFEPSAVFAEVQRYEQLLLDAREALRRRPYMPRIEHSDPTRTPAALEAARWRRDSR